MRVIGGPRSEKHYSGPMHVYEVEPGVTIQLHEDEARERYGLEPPEAADAKTRSPAKNKKRAPAENK